LPYYFIFKIGKGTKFQRRKAVVLHEGLKHLSELSGFLAGSKCGKPDDFLKKCRATKLLFKSGQAQKKK
jgi:hypothetical protein